MFAEDEGMNRHSIQDLWGHENENWGILTMGEAVHVGLGHI